MLVNFLWDFTVFFFHFNFTNSGHEKFIIQSFLQIFLNLTLKFGHFSVFATALPWQGGAYRNLISWDDQEPGLLIKTLKRFMCFVQSYQSRIVFPGMLNNRMNRGFV